MTWFSLSTEPSVSSVFLSFIFALLASAVTSLARRLNQLFWFLASIGDHLNQLIIFVGLRCLKQIVKDTAITRENGKQLVRNEEEQGDSTHELLRRLGAPDHPHEEGVMTPPMGIGFGNADPVPFENELCWGKFLSLHRPTYDKALYASGDYRYGEHFSGKRRIWEARIQLHFKHRAEASELFFGAEAEQYVPLSSALTRAVGVFNAMLRRVVGNSMYQTLGDDPQKVSGELEKPGIFMPLWAFDQFFVTQEGEEPPELSDPGLGNMGSKRVGRVAAYRKEVNELDLRCGPTYTFCFWGFSRFVDKVKGEITGIPLICPMDLRSFAGSSPIHVKIYSLEPGAENERRHFDSRRRVYFDVAFWSSLKRPSRARLSSLLSSGADDTDAATVSSGLGLTSAIVSRASAWATCCVSR